MLLEIQVRDQRFEFNLKQGPILIGRKTGSLVLKDPYCSQPHANIYLLPNGEARILDLGSCNGTFLNGFWVERSRIQNGDHIRIGRTWLIVSKLSVKRNRIENVRADKQVILNDVANNSVSTINGLCSFWPEKLDCKPSSYRQIFTPIDYRAQVLQPQYRRSIKKE